MELVVIENWHIMLALRGSVLGEVVLHGGRGRCSEDLFGFASNLKGGF